VNYYETDESNYCPNCGHVLHLEDFGRLIVCDHCDYTEKNPMEEASAFDRDDFNPKSSGPIC
jgi:DNA-directed RNA polymerase subunit M/transcription elongation factor TFIIS